MANRDKIIDEAQQEIARMYKEFLKLEKKVRTETANNSEIREMRRLAKSLGIKDAVKLTRRQLMRLRLM